MRRLPIVETPDQRGASTGHHGLLGLPRRQGRECHEPTEALRRPPHLTYGARLVEDAMESISELEGRVKQRSVPKHVGIIMDGNRRWARERGLPTLEGHRRGYDKLKEAGDWCLSRGIKYLTVFAFSTENWKRDKKEVAYLMRLLFLGLSYLVSFLMIH
jgi:hypothetical protein